MCCGEDSRGWMSEYEMYSCALPVDPFYTENVSLMHDGSAPASPPWFFWIHHGWCHTPKWYILHVLWDFACIACGLVNLHKGQQSWLPGTKCFVVETGVKCKCHVNPLICKVIFWSTWTVNVNSSQFFSRFPPAVSAGLDASKSHSGGGIAVQDASTPEGFTGSYEWNQAALNIRMKD